MKEKKKTEYIEYLDGFTVDGDGNFFPVKHGERVVMNSVRRYYNCLYLLAGLSPCARNLMDYITEEMDDDNIIHSNSWTRDSFMRFITDVTGGSVVYQDTTVKAGFAELSKSGLLMAKARGVFRVNPKFFFRGSEAERIEQIMFQIRLSSENTNFKILDNKFKIK